jgi:hypothetical protein
MLASLIHVMRFKGAERLAPILDAQFRYASAVESRTNILPAGHSRLTSSRPPSFSYPEITPDTHELDF